MAKKYKDSDVSISFHYLKRTKFEGSVMKAHPITYDEFDKVFEKLQSSTQVNLKSEEQLSRVQLKLLLPIEKVERVDERTICGVFKNTYWGHSIENSKFGELPADSINLRPFFFILYLSETGRLYLGAQYLGMYGGYTNLRDYILSAIPNKNEIVSISFNRQQIDFNKATPKALEVQYTRHADESSKTSRLGNKGVIVFKTEKGDLQSENELRKSFFGSMSEKHAVSEIKKVLQKSDLIEMDDMEIEKAKVIAVVNGKRKPIHLLEASSFATKFFVPVPLDNRGHPPYEKVKLEAQKLIAEQILKSAENV